MHYALRPMERSERQFSYSNSDQISLQTGLIGHLRADMDTDGTGFFSSWFGYNDDLKTEEFKKEFDGVINSLRAEGHFLKNRKALAIYCYSHPDTSFGNDREYGVTAVTEDYIYLLRLNPNKGEYNLYCYCYKKIRLQDHMREARKGIRFITPMYDDLFRLPDGGKIRITYEDGVSEERICRYIDPYHLETEWRRIFHICEFAEWIQRIGATVEPVQE